jgi:hypothetical protein
LFWPLYCLSCLSFSPFLFWPLYCLSCLSFSPFCFDHWIVCPVYPFLFFVLTIVLPVLSILFFYLFWPLYCLSCLSNNCFWLPLWYLHTFRTLITNLRKTTSALWLYAILVKCIKN